jgi:tetrahydromethanopterin S-methyltransferase subunit B
MGNENLAPPSVSDMVRVTADNSVVFMQQIAEHIDKLEQTVIDLQKRIAELEGTTNDDQ